jgi:hypothetical protein
MFAEVQGSRRCCHLHYEVKVKGLFVLTLISPFCYEV